MGNTSPDMQWHHPSSQGQSLSAPQSPRAGQKRSANGDAVGGRSTYSTRPSSPNQVELTSRQRRVPFDPDASLVLIGIRGSGKRSLGFIAAAALGRRFVTEDHYFLQTTGQSRQDYLRTYGSEAFYKEDINVSKKMLTENRAGAVIDCGLSSLTNGLQEFLKSYAQTNPVVHIVRDMSAIRDLLKLSDRATELLANSDPSHRRCSNLEYFNLEDESSDTMDHTSENDRSSPAYSFQLTEAQADFSTFTKRVTGCEFEEFTEDVFSLKIPIETRCFTHTLQIPLTKAIASGFDVRALEAGGDVCEITIDAWQADSVKALSRLVASIRRHLKLPIMVSARRPCASMPLNLYFGALRHALRLSVDYIAVDLSLEAKWIEDFTWRCERSRVLGDFSQLAVDSPYWDVKALSVICDKAIAAKIDLVRLVCHSNNWQDNTRIAPVIEQLKVKYDYRLGFIAYNVGPHARSSQVLNMALTAVTHSELETLADYGMDASLAMITAKEATEALFASFQFDPLQHFVLGANVSESLSPAMHNRAYKALGLHHRYEAINVKDWDEIERIAMSSSFGGASIAQPWKVKIMSKIVYASKHARAIGAINTLLPVKGLGSVESLLPQQATWKNRRGPVVAWYGANTDWISIKNCLSKMISPRNVIQPKTSALIVGAGGMARAATYAVIQLGCQNIVFYNRTRENAQRLVDHFSKWLASTGTPDRVQFRVLSTVKDAWPDDLSQPTIIISGITHEKIPGEESVANFTVPDQWLRSETGGTAVEQAYYIDTPFVKHLRSFTNQSGVPWTVVDGMEVLHSQGSIQFEMMTGRYAPRSAMRAALHQELRRRQTQNDTHMAN